MKVEKVQGRSREELEADLKQQRQTFYELRSQAVTEKLEDPTELRKHRRHIARILTELRAQDIEAQKQKVQA